MKYRGLRCMAAALLAALSMWCYAERILIPYQIEDAARTGRPRGNLSDLYPRWLGARELLLRKRDPYSAEVTREIQAGYYGRPLDPERARDPKDQQGFAYPIYIAFFLWPTVGLKFDVVQVIFKWMLVLMIAGLVPLWLYVLRWRSSCSQTLIGIALVLGSFPAVQAIKLQQLSAVVCALLAGCAAMVVSEHLVLAGVFLALATIKPQLAAPFAAWLVVWASGNWHSRQRLMWSFVASVTALVLAGELLLPGWMGRFLDASRAYLQYTGSSSLLDLALSPAVGRAVAVLVACLTGVWCWRWRQVPADAEEFRWAVALILAVTLIVIPTFAPYNQLLLIPAIMLLVREADVAWTGDRLRRVLFMLAAVAVIAPWLAAVALDTLSFLVPQAAVEKAWAVPLWTSWAIPFPVLAAVVVCAARVGDSTEKREPILAPR